MRKLVLIPLTRKVKKKERNIRSGSLSGVLCDSLLVFKSSKYH